MELLRNQLLDCDPLEYAQLTLQREFQQQYDEAVSSQQQAEHELKSALYEQKIAIEATDPTSGAAIRLASTITQQCMSVAKAHSSWVSSAILDKGGRCAGEDGFTSRACALVSAIRQAVPMTKRAGAGPYVIGCALYSILRHRILVSLSQTLSDALDRKANVNSAIQSQVSAITDVAVLVGSSSTALVEDITAVWHNVYENSGVVDVSDLLRDTFLSPLSALFSMFYSLVALEPLSESSGRIFRPTPRGEPVDLSRCGLRLLGLPSAASIEVLRQIEVSCHNSLTFFSSLQNPLLAVEPGDDILVGWALRGTVRLPSGACVFPQGPIIPGGGLAGELRALVHVPQEAGIAQVYTAAFTDYTREMALTPYPHIPSVPEYVQLNGVSVFECSARLICALTHLLHLITVALPSWQPEMWAAVGRAMSEHRAVLTRFIAQQPTFEAALALLSAVLAVMSFDFTGQLESELQHWMKLQFKVMEYISKRTATLALDKRGSTMSQVSTAFSDIAVVAGQFEKYNKQVLSTIQKSTLHIIDSSLASELRAAKEQEKRALVIERIQTIAQALRTALPTHSQQLPSALAVAMLSECSELLNA